MSKRRAYLALALIVGGIVLMGAESAFAQTGDVLAAGFLDDKGAKNLGGAGNINTAMLITAAMIEGATLFAVLGCFLAAIKN
jgi:hypothetical protein